MKYETRKNHVREDKACKNGFSMAVVKMFGIRSDSIVLGSMGGDPEIIKWDVLVGISSGDTGI